MKNEKRRYILVESAVEIPDASASEFETELLKEIMKTVGETHYFRANPKMMGFIDNKTFVLRCNLSRYRDMIVALTFIKRVSGKEIGLYTLKSSGTIKALTKDVIKTDGL